MILNINIPLHDVDDLETFKQFQIEEIQKINNIIELTSAVHNNIFLYGDTLSYSNELSNFEGIEF